MSGFQLKSHRVLECFRIAYTRETLTAFRRFIPGEETHTNSAHVSGP